MDGVEDLDLVAALGFAIIKFDVAVTAAPRVETVDGAASVREVIGVVLSRHCSAYDRDGLTAEVDHEALVDFGRSVDDHIFLGRSAVCGGGAVREVKAAGAQQVVVLSGLGRIVDLRNCPGAEHECKRFLVVGKTAEHHDALEVLLQGTRVVHRADVLAEEVDRAGEDLATVLDGNVVDGLLALDESDLVVELHISSFCIFPFKNEVIRIIINL